MKKMICFLLVAFSLCIPLSGCSTTLFSPQSSSKDDADFSKYFSRAPVRIYHTSASENGLGDTLMYCDGILGEINETSGYSYFKVFPRFGEIAILDLDITENGLADIKPGEKARVYFLYSGMSSVLDSAAGVFVDISYEPTPTNRLTDRMCLAIALFVDENYAAVKESLYEDYIRRAQGKLLN